MADRRSFISELRRRNVLRAGALYVGAVWALAQGISQLGPAVGLPDWSTRWFLVAAIVGFPFWIAFAWFYEFTPQGFKRESDVADNAPLRHSNARKLDWAIIGVLALAVVLLATQLLWRKAAPVPTASAPSSTQAAPAKSIAVLPLANESGDKDQQYFSDGLSEDLITALTQFQGLKVIARDSSFKFRNSRDDPQAIGAKLGVAHLLEGSVQRAGDVVRVSATLINVADGTALWSQHYDRPYKDLFKLQDEITLAVTNALKARLLQTGSGALQSDRPPSGNLDAYTAYQQGKFYAARNNEPDLRKAVEHLLQAVRLDSKYAAAWVALGAAQSRIGANYLGGAEAAAMYAHAQVSVDTALRLDTALPLAHVVKASLKASRDLDWRGAHEEYRRAFELAPNDPGVMSALARSMAMLGQVRAAIDLEQRALKLDPLNAGIHQGLALFLAANGHLDEASAAVGKAVELQPGSDTYRVFLADIQALRGDYPAAWATAQSMPSGLWRDDAMAVVLQVGRDRAAADTALKNLIDKHADQSSWQVAEAYGLRRDPDNMFKWMDRALDTRDGGIVFLLHDPFLLRYKDDPRFAAFAKKVGLPTTTDAVGLP